MKSQSEGLSQAETTQGGGPVQNHSPQLLFVPGRLLGTDSRMMYVFPVPLILPSDLTSLHPLPEQTLDP